MLWIYFDRQGVAKCKVNVGNKIRQGDAVELFIHLEDDSKKVLNVAALKPDSSEITTLLSVTPGLTEKTFSLGNPSEANFYFKNGETYAGYATEMPSDVTSFFANGGHLGLMVTIASRADETEETQETISVYVEPTYGKKATGVTKSDYDHLIDLYDNYIAVIENGTAENSGQQIGTPKTIDFTGKNANAIALDPALGGTQYAGGQGINSLALGGKSSAQGKRSMAVGTTTIAKGAYSFASGDNSVALGNDSHAEGYATTSFGQASHSEGTNTMATGNYSHAEGANSSASGESSHAEGSSSIATGDVSHAEGEQSSAKGRSAHAEGSATRAFGDYSHSEGAQTNANGSTSHAEGNATSVKNESYSRPESDKPSSDGSSPSGGSSSEGGSASDLPYGASAHAEGTSTVASGYASHAEGNKTISNGHYSHAEGYYTDAIGQSSHAEGHFTQATGSESHAEGADTIASGKHSHAEGRNTTASGNNSHAEGEATSALGPWSHAGGLDVKAEGDASFAHGYNVGAYAEYSAAFGSNTGATAANQFVCGVSNAEDKNALFIVGNNKTTNAFEVLSDGRAKVQTQPKDDDDVVTLGYAGRYESKYSVNNVRGWYGNVIPLDLASMPAGQLFFAAPNSNMGYNMELYSSRGDGGLDRLNVGLLGNKSYYVWKSLPIGNASEMQQVASGLASSYLNADGTHNVRFGTYDDSDGWGFKALVTDPSKSANYDGTISLGAKNYKFAYDSAVDVFSSDGNTTAIKSPMGSASVELANGEAMIKANKTTITLPSSSAQISIGGFIVTNIYGTTFYGGNTFDNAPICISSPTSLYQLANKSYVDNTVVSKAAEYANTEKVRAQNEEQALQNAIDAINASQNFVATYATEKDLPSAPTAGVLDGDCALVLKDSTKNNQSTVYKWVGAPYIRWEYVGELGDYYTKAQINTMHTEMETTCKAYSDTASANAVKAVFTATSSKTAESE